MNLPTELQDDENKTSQFKPTKKVSLNMEREIVFGHWYEVEGPMCNEWIPAELVGMVKIKSPDGNVVSRYMSLDELQEFDRVTGDAEQESEGDAVRFPIPSSLADYCENKEAWKIDLVEGYGARLQMPGYLDCTEWAVFETEKEAEDYLEEMYGDDEVEEDEYSTFTYQTTPEGDLFIVSLPGDLFDSIDQLAHYAIDHARENAPDYVMPANWTAKHVSGEIGDNEVTFHVLRSSNRG